MPELRMHPFNNNCLLLSVRLFIHIYLYFESIMKSFTINFCTDVKTSIHALTIRLK